MAPKPSRSPLSSEPISAAQYIFLKLFDAYIQSPSIAQSFPPAASTSFLIPATTQVMSFLTTTMQALIDGRDGSVHGSPFSDLRFEKVYGALVLLLQSLLAVGLREGDVKVGLQTGHESTATFVSAISQGLKEVGQSSSEASHKGVIEQAISKRAHTIPS